MEIHGRYQIWAATPPATVAAYVRGAPAARARLWLEWNAKVLAKRIGPGVYERARQAWASR
jgi:hypothetical protein